MFSLHELFDAFRLRPAMYTGELTLVSIGQFLGGYRLAADNNIGVRPDDPFVIPHEFHDWVAYRLHFYESTSGWCGMICSQSPNDRAAVERFFLLLDEFRKRVPHVVAKLTGYSRSYQQISYVKKKETIENLQYPDSISLLTYTDDPGFFAYSDTDVSFPFEGFFPTLERFESCTGVSRDLLTIIDPDWHA